LIAGSTGSGKSVNIHTILMSLLYRNPPEMLRFILIDPKRVELSMYNEIPHLLTPVIHDGKKTIQSLRWCVHEMERRYEMLSQEHVRDLASYNAKIAKQNDSDKELIPYIVIVIDELADLMMAFPREVEAAIVRLAQMARAIGIHLIVSTQRPSVEVITGLIKANITSRIAFQVASQIDSRTILDMSGAEKLLGSGDMLFLAGDTAKPRRIQGAFVSEHEVKKVVEFLKNEVEEPQYEEGIFGGGDGSQGALSFDDSDGGSDDELYEEAKRVVIEAGKASASYLQRRLKVGYARAARLLDMLEERGLIGPGDGAKPREILTEQRQEDGDRSDLAE
jgi:DNA segregation ATPase FtsK/SpoIIIE, S-DNA-T family